jgi:hypothetical protein
VRQYCSLVNSSTRPASTVNDVVQLLQWVEVEPWDSLSTFKVETQLMKMAGNNDSDADRSRPDAFILSILLQL